MLSIPLRPTTMATLSTHIQEVISIPSEEQFKFVLRITDKVPAMVQNEDKVFEKSESDTIWVTKKELLQAVPTRLRPLINSEILAYVLPELGIELNPVEYHIGDTLGTKVLDHDSIIHEVVKVETCSMELLKEALAFFK